MPCSSTQGAGCLDSDMPKNANASFHQLHQNYTLKFTFKPGEQYIYENIFSLCLEMGLCTINEVYDYPYYVLFPVLEAINWSRENPCFSWPSYAFDLIGRNDLSILKSNSESIGIESSAQNNLGILRNLAADGSNDDRLPSSCSSVSSTKPSINSMRNQSINFLNFGYRRSIKSKTSSNDYQADNEENSLTLNVCQSVKKEDEDGMQHIAHLETLKCRFNEDLRINEVCFISSECF
jgi:hypothetical protein